MIAHAEAVAAVVTASGGHGYLADDIKRLPSPPAAYTEVYSMARPEDNDRIGCLGLTVRRLITRSVGISQRKAESERAAADLTGKSFVVAGETFGPLRRETADDVIDDDGNGLWSGVTTWTYA